MFAKLVIVPEVATTLVAYEPPQVHVHLLLVLLVRCFVQERLFAGVTLEPVLVSVVFVLDVFFEVALSVGSVLAALPLAYKGLVDLVRLVDILDVQIQRCFDDFLPAGRALDHPLFVTLLNVFAQENPCLPRVFALGALVGPPTPVTMFGPQVLGQGAQPLDGRVALVALVIW